MDLARLVEQAKALAERTQQYAGRSQQLAALDIPVTADRDHDSEHLESAVQQSRQRCEELWHKLTITQTSIQTELNQGATNSQASIAQTMEDRLKAELEASSLNNLTVEPKNPATVKLLVERSIRDSIAQLHETLAVLNTDIQAIQAEKQLEEQYFHEHQTIKLALQHRLVEINTNARTSVETMSNFERQLTVKCRQHVERNTELLKRLGSFMDTYYPNVTMPIEPQQPKKKSKTETSETDPKPTQTFSLKTLLEDLMNLAVTRPSDPYLRLRPQHWPPHVELLLRAGIVDKHPKDGGRIKLVEFHL